MKKLIFSLIFIAASMPAAQAKDVALILNDQEQQMMLQAIDATVRAQGVQAASSMLHLLQKLQTAPAVTETAPDKPAEQKKDEGK